MNMVYWLVILTMAIHIRLASMQFEAAPGYEERRQHNIQNMKPDQHKDDSFLYTLMYGIFEEKKNPFINESSTFLNYDAPETKSESTLIWKTETISGKLSNIYQEDDRDVFLYYQDLGMEITNKNMISSIEAQRFKMYVESADLSIITEAFFQSKQLILYSNASNNYYKKMREHNPSIKDNISDIQQSSDNNQLDMQTVPARYRNQIANELESKLKYLYAYKKKLDTDELARSTPEKKKLNFILNITDILEKNRKALHDAFMQKNISAIVNASKNPRQIDLLIKRLMPEISIITRSTRSNSDSDIKISMNPLLATPKIEKEKEKKSNNPLLKIPLLRRVFSSHTSSSSTPEVKTSSLPSSISPRDLISPRKTSLRPSPSAITVEFLTQYTSNNNNDDDDNNNNTKNWKKANTPSIHGSLQRTLSSSDLECNSEFYSSLPPSPNPSSASPSLPSLSPSPPKKP